MPAKTVIPGVDEKKLARARSMIGAADANEWYFRYAAPDGAVLYRSDGHLFTQLFDGSIIDLSGRDDVAYHNGVSVSVFDGPPSEQAQIVQHAYEQRPMDQFSFREDSDEWRVPLYPRAYAGQLLKGWRDPYGAPVLSIYNGVTVVRDDTLKCGSKARFVDALISLHPEIDEWVFGSCPAQGWAQVSLTEVCNRHGKQAHYFMAQRNPANYTSEQKAGLALGGHYHWVPNGMLPVTQARAREYVAEKPDSRMVLPIGLEHELVTAAIIDVASQLVEPREVWSVASSGTLSRGLQVAFPNARVHAVSVGHKMSPREIGRAQFWRSPLKFERGVADGDAPPYPSVSNYDAKVWPFVRDHASGRGALVWNVAANLDERIAG